MTGVARFQELQAWQTARELTNQVYALTNQAGFNRDFGLRDQILPASQSSPSPFIRRTN
jgi:four helix bundle protein